MTSQIETKSRGWFGGAVFVLCAALHWRKSGHIETTSRKREAFRLAWCGQTRRWNFKKTTGHPHVLFGSDSLRTFFSSEQPPALDGAIKQNGFFRALISKPPPRPADKKSL